MINNTLSFQTQSSTPSTTYSSGTKNPKLLYGLLSPKGVPPVAAKPAVQAPTFSVTNQPKTTGLVSTTPKANPAPAPLAVATSTPVGSGSNQIAPGITTLGLTPEQQAGIKTAQSMVASPVTPSNPITPAPVRGLFPDVVSSLAKDSIDRNKALADKAQSISDTYGREYADIGKRGAAAEGGYLTTGTSPVAEGNAAVIAQTRGIQQQAVAQGAQMALGGVDRGLTAQGQTQSALGTAGSLAQPSNNFPFVFDPVTGGFTAPGVGGTAQSSGLAPTFNPQTDAQSYARAIMDKKISFNDALSALSYAGNVANSYLNNAILALGGNPTNLQAEAAGTASVLGGLPALESAETAAQGIKNKIVSYLSANPQLNPTELAASNALEQWINGRQLTNPKYQTLFNYIDEYTNTLAPILGVGGSPTNLKTEIAQGFVNAKASGASIAEVLENMATLASGKLQDMRSGASGGGVVSSSAVGGSPAGGSNSFSTQAKDGNTYNFYQDANGKWVSQ